MTKPTQDKETLREAVARAICNQSGSACHGSCVTNPCRSAINLHGKDADAAIATMFERLRTPSEGMLKAGEHAWMNRDLNDPASHPIRDCFRAMLTAFQQENSDEQG